MAKTLLLNDEYELNIWTEPKCNPRLAMAVEWLRLSVEGCKANAPMVRGAKLHTDIVCSTPLGFLEEESNG